MSNQQQPIHLEGEISDETSGKRLDQALAVLFPQYSRSKLKEWIDTNQVKINGGPKRPRDKVSLGDKIEINAVLEVISDWQGEPIPLDIIYEDEWLLVMNKPANWVVHPAIGNRSGTVVNALLHRYPSLSQIPRAGVVHRLDKDTTGLMVVAKCLIAQTHLVAALQARTVKKIYEGIVSGVLPSGGTITTPIGRHPTDRIRMAVVESGGKGAITHYRVIEKFKAHTRLRIEIETGRTHQIRVHMAHMHHPIVGDRTYGGRFRLPPNASASLQTQLREFPRQALHAKELILSHPVTGEEMHWIAPLPKDIVTLLAELGSKSLV